MNQRLQKKCLLASVVFHLTLLGVLFFGSGFLSSRPPEELQILEIVPLIVTDANVNPGGGNPKAKPPPSDPEPPAPKPRAESPPPRPERTREPETPKTPVKTEKSDPNSLETKKAWKPNKPQPNLTPWKNPSPKPKPSRDTEREALARAEAERRRLAGSVARSLRENLSSATTVEMPGPGGGGATYARYKDLVGSVYYQAWQVSDDVDADDATAVASVTIARDGTVLSARIIKSSGNRGVDRSVQATLDRVRFIEPFPEGAKDSERTFTINFNLKARKAIG